MRGNKSKGLNIGVFILRIFKRRNHFKNIATTTTIFPRIIVKIRVTVSVGNHLIVALYFGNLFAKLFCVLFKSFYDCLVKCICKGFINGNF